MNDTEKLIRELRASLDRTRLDRRRRFLVSIASAVASARDDATRAVTEEALRERVHASEIYEVILQGYLTGGYPRTINAFMEFRAAQEALTDRWRPAPAGWDDPDTPEEWFTRGEALCRRIYTTVFGRLRDRLTSLSPDLFHWLLMEGYGKVIGRPGLPIEDRELCLLASLVVLGIPRQTRSHLRGALILGFSGEQIEELLYQSSLFATDTAIASAETILADLLKDRSKSE